MVSEGTKYWTFNAHSKHTKKLNNSISGPRSRASPPRWCVISLKSWSRLVEGVIIVVGAAPSLRAFTKMLSAETSGKWIFTVLVLMLNALSSQIERRQSSPRDALAVMSRKAVRTDQRSLTGSVKVIWILLGSGRRLCLQTRTHWPMSCMTLRPGSSSSSRKLAVRLSIRGYHRVRLPTTPCTKPPWSAIIKRLQNRPNERSRSIKNPTRYSHALQHRK